MLFTILVAGAFLALGWRKRPTGFYLGWFLLMYGLFRLFLDTLHVDAVNHLWSADPCFPLTAAMTGTGMIAALGYRGRIERGAISEKPAAP